MSEPLNRMLAELPLAEPDAARAARIRTRCNERLARRTPSPAASRVPRAHITVGARGFSRATTQVWQPLIAVLSVAYLTEVIVQAIRVYVIP